MLLIIGFSLPLFFLVGVAWPAEGIPELLRRASFALPSTSGIDGLVRLKRWGASLGDVVHDWRRLWALVVVYALLAAAATRPQHRREGPMSSTRRLLFVAGIAAVIAGMVVLARGRRDGFAAADDRHGAAQTEIRIAPRRRPPGDPRRRARPAGEDGRPACHPVQPGTDRSVGEARSALASAKAERDHVFAGVRAEQVAIAAQAVETAEANLVLAQAQYDRAAALAAKGFASHQELDEATASLAKAKADLDLKRAEHDEARGGTDAGGA